MIPLKHSARMEYFKNNNFQNSEILPLLVEHVDNFKAMNPDPKKGYQKYADIEHPIIGRILGEVLYVFVEKIIGSGKFKGYSDEWKEDMRSRAYINICKYLHNFDPVKANNNAIGYLYSSIETNIVQEVKKLKASLAEYNGFDFDDYNRSACTASPFRMNELI